MEIVRGGELFDRIVGAGRLTPAVARRYFQQICDAVFYCHLQVREDRWHSRINTEALLFL